MNEDPKELIFMLDTKLKPIKLTQEHINSLSETNKMEWNNPNSEITFEVISIKEI